jgi:hypothetical protein
MFRDGKPESLGQLAGRMGVENRGLLRFTKISILFMNLGVLYTNSNISFERDLCYAAAAHTPLKPGH